MASDREAVVVSGNVFFHCIDLSSLTNIFRSLNLLKTGIYISVHLKPTENEDWSAL